MKITIVCDVLGAENNGTTVAAMNLIRSLREKNHDVTVVCPDEERKGESGYVAVEPINFGILNNYVKSNGVCIARPDDDSLEKAISGSDVVHLVTPFFLAAHALKIAQSMGIPVTASFHCQAENLTNHLRVMNSRIANRKTYKVFYDTIYSRCTAVHYPTEFIREVFEESVGHKTNAYVISNGVSKRFCRRSVEKPQEMKDKTVILFTGRYSREKSHSVLINAVLASRYSDKIQLIFAGAGPLEQKLRKQAEKLPVFPEFKFFSREEMLDVLNYSDLYVHPAEIEIEAIACLEAITCGLVPVISDSPRSATRFFAMGERNLFRCNDPTSLAERIDWWIEHPAEKEECRKEYEGFAKQFDQDICMDMMERMLKEAAATRVCAHE